MADLKPARARAGQTKKATCSGFNRGYNLARGQPGREKRRCRDAMRKLFLPAIAVACLLTVPARAQQSGTHGGHVYSIEPSPKTVVWGYYSAHVPPVLRVKSGDIVRVHTLITSTPPSLERAGVPASEVEPSLREIFKQVKVRGPGGHILDGPIYVEGAEPGDVLEIRILKIRLAIPYAYNAFVPGKGFLPDDFPYFRMKIIPLDAKRMIAHFAPGIDIPLHPFFGSMGVAPPPFMRKISSNPPWFHGGNMDNKELVAGTTLYLPVQAPGALFFVGDGHAGQGDGEVDITAMETSLIGTLQFIVRKDMHLLWPEAETPTKYISMGFSPSLEEATKMSVRNMIHFLVTEKHLTRSQAYMLTSVAGDVCINELVDGSVGVHTMIPKAIFVKSKKRGR
jgi:acetamidase/formamidase